MRGKTLFQRSSVLQCLECLVNKLVSERRKLLAVK